MHFKALLSFLISLCNIYLAAVKGACLQVPMGIGDGTLTGQSCITVTGFFMDINQHKALAVYTTIQVQGMYLLHYTRFLFIQTYIR